MNQHWGQSDEAMFIFPAASDVCHGETVFFTV